MDVIDNDTLEAIRNAWALSAAALPPLPQAGRLKSPQALPYAAVACESEGQELSGTIGAWIDRRKVTITVRGLKADVVTALAQVRAKFNRFTMLAFPSGAYFMLQSKMLKVQHQLRWSIGRFPGDFHLALAVRVNRKAVGRCFSFTGGHIGSQHSSE